MSKVSAAVKPTESNTLMKNKVMQSSVLFRSMLAFAIMATAYISLIFILPANKVTMQLYHMTPIEYRFLYFAIALPIIGVWFAAFFGYAQLSRYSQRLKMTPEGPSMATLTHGLGWLAWGLPIPSLVTISINAIANGHPGFHSTTIIISNYLTLILLLIAFSIISRAARQLYSQSSKRRVIGLTRNIVFWFVLEGVIYCLLVFRTLNIQHLSATNNPYHMPAWLVIVSIVIVYLYTWFIGLLASYELSIYAKHVRGLLYKQPFRILVSGLVTVLIGLIALQFLNSVSPAVGHLAVNYKLVLSTTFRIIGGIGYILIAIGAYRLRRIEDV